MSKCSIQSWSFKKKLKNLQNVQIRKWFCEPSGERRRKFLQNFHFHFRLLCLLPFSPLLLPSPVTLLVLAMHQSATAMHQSMLLQPFTRFHPWAMFHTAHQLHTVPFIHHGLFVLGKFRITWTKNSNRIPNGVLMEFFWKKLDFEKFLTTMCS